MADGFEPGILYECATPPVIEVIIGVAFEPIDGLDSVHFGAYWERQRKRFPEVSIRGPILPPVAPPKVANLENGEQVLVRIDPSVRYWLIDAADEELIQVQSDRFFRNWRKRPTGGTYPQFSELWTRFADSWAEYLVFLDECRFPQPKVLQCELAYINQIQCGGRPLAWAVPALAGFGAVSSHVVSTESRSLVRMDLPDGAGQAQLDAQPTGAGEWRYSLSAKGAPTVVGIEGIWAWLIAARGWLNHLFVSSLGEGYRAELGVRPRQ